MSVFYLISFYFSCILHMSVVCLFCMCIRMLVQSISVFFACCVFMGLAAWNKMDDDDSVDRCSSTDACGLSTQSQALAEGRRLISSACNFVAVVTISHRVAQRARVIGRVADGQEFPTRFFPPVRCSLPPPIQSSNRPQQCMIDWLIDWQRSAGWLRQTRGDSPLVQAYSMHGSVHAATP